MALRSGGEARLKERVVGPRGGQMGRRKGGQKRRAAVVRARLPRRREKALGEGALMLLRAFLQAFSTHVAERTRKNSAPGEERETKKPKRRKEKGWGKGTGDEGALKSTSSVNKKK